MSAVDIVPVITVYVGALGFVAMLAIFRNLAEIDIHRLCQGICIIRTGFIITLLDFHSIDMAHVLHPADSESDTSVLIGENRVAHSQIIVIAIIPVGATPFSRHLMVGIPAVHSAELIIAYACLVIGTASESIETVTFLLVKSSECEAVVILEILHKQIIHRGSVHGKLSEEISRRIGEASCGSRPVGHETVVQEDVVACRHIGAVNEIDCRAGVDIIVA